MAVSMFRTPLLLSCLLAVLYLQLPRYSSQTHMNSCPATALDFRRHTTTVSRRLHKQHSCALHGLMLCPVCQEAEYMQRRVIKAVNSSLKRLGVQKTKPVLSYLGADTWVHVLELLQAKRNSWNTANPGLPMTPTNIALDHIRPVHSFAGTSDGARIFLCNHYTNLQPLLHEDNAWKGDCWSAADEEFWHENIILKKEYDNVYYPQAAPMQPSLLFSTRHKK
jgi:hypothetical protein